MLMTRKLAMLIAATSVTTAIGIGVALMVRSPRAAHVGTVGTITPRTAIAPTGTGREQRLSPAAPPPTYPTATTVPPALPPATIRIPAIGLDASIVPVGLIPGSDSLQIPDIHHVGWYRLGPSPGQSGSAVLVGHIDGEGQPGIFWHLGQLTPGDQISITDNTDRTRTFRVTGRKQVAKTALPAELFSRAGPPRIALITCGGAFDTATRHYHDNVVVVATPT
jgi:hypothetical protein